MPAAVLSRKIKENQMSARKFHRLLSRCQPKRKFWSQKQAERIYLQEKEEVIQLNEWEQKLKL